MIRTGLLTSTHEMSAHGRCSPPPQPPPFTPLPPPTLLWFQSELCCLFGEAPSAEDPRPSAGMKLDPDAGSFGNACRCLVLQASTGSHKHGGVSARGLSNLSFAHLDTSGSSCCYGTPRQLRKYGFYRRDTASASPLCDAGLRVLSSSPVVTASY